MGIEVRDKGGKGVGWCGTRMPHADGSIDSIEVGNYEFEKTEIAIGILRFLAGSKSFKIGNIFVRVPDTPQGDVVFGHLELPYEEFVAGVCWFLGQGGRPGQEFQIPANYALCSFAIPALRKSLLKEMPNPKPSVWEAAEGFEAQYKKPEGIYGLAGTR